MFFMAIGGFSYWECGDHRKVFKDSNRLSVSDVMDVTTGFLNGEQSPIVALFLISFLIMSFFFWWQTSWIWDYSQSWSTLNIILRCLCNVRSIAVNYVDSLSRYRSRASIVTLEVCTYNGFWDDHPFKSAVEIANHNQVKGWWWLMPFHVGTSS